MSKRSCSHCGGTSYHKPGCIAFLARVKIAREVSSESLPDVQPIAELGALFVAVKRSIVRGAEHVATAVSHNMAKRIASALNSHKPNSRGY